MYCPRCGKKMTGSVCGFCGHIFDDGSVPTKNPARGADAEQRHVYEAALSLEAAAKTAEDFSMAASLYEKLGQPGYGDSEARAVACREQARQMLHQREVYGKETPPPASPELLLKLLRSRESEGSPPEQHMPGPLQPDPPRREQSPLPSRKPGGKKKTAAAVLAGLIVLLVIALALWYVLPRGGREDGGKSLSARTESPDAEPTLSPAPSPTSTPEIPAGLAYEVSGGGMVCITGYSGTTADLVIPGEIDGHRVTGIGEGAFFGCSGLRSVTVPDSVTSIGNSAFLGCASLTGIRVSGDNACYSDGSGVLFNREKTVLLACPGGIAGEYSVPGSVTSIGAYAFSGCGGLRSVTLPEGLTDIGNYAFSGCSGLTGMTLPGSVTGVGWKAFSGCSALTVFALGGASETFSVEAGVLFDRNRTGLIACPGGMKGNYAVPAGVTSIGRCAFDCCGGLTGVTVPDSVTRIGEAAFSNCAGLESVTIPESVTSIDSRAFENCPSLKNVYYGGTQEAWNRISMGDHNEDLTSAEIQCGS